MIVTMTNVSGRAINVPAVGEDGVSLPGGNHPEEATHRTDPLPYPFAHVGEVAIAGTSILPMHHRDWRYSRSQMRGMPMSEKWQMMVQDGVVTLGYAAEVDLRDEEDLFEDAV